MTTLLRIGLLAPLALLSLSACQREGILRLDVSAPNPGDTADRGYLVVEVAGDPSEAQWDNQSFGTVHPGLNIPLDGERVVAELDILADQPMRRVAVRTRYCTHELCIGDPPRPSFRYLFARSIWVGHVSHFTITVPPRELEGTVLADIPRDPGEGRTVSADQVYPSTGWICRCQLGCEVEPQDIVPNCDDAFTCSSARHLCE